MGAFWLCLPEDIVRGLGHFARAVVGGTAGLLSAYALVSRGRGYDTPQQGDGREGGPVAPGDRPRG